MLVSWTLTTFNVTTASGVFKVKVVVTHFLYNQLISVLKAKVTFDLLVVRVPFFWVDCSVLTFNAVSLGSSCLKVFEHTPGLLWFGHILFAFTSKMTSTESLPSCNTIGLNFTDFLLTKMRHSAEC